MATNLSIDPKLLERALAVSGERTKKATVTKALQEFIARREQKRVVELFRSLDRETGYDYKAERSRQ
jgi:hypothetical protein